MEAIKKIKNIILSTLFLMVTTAGCTGSGALQADKPPLMDYTYYRDIPGVTAEEISAVEALREQRDGFVCGSVPSTVAFYNDNGEIGGFLAQSCQWLSELFGIPFTPAISSCIDIVNGLETGDIDFKGGAAPNSNGLADYYKTSPFAQCAIKYYIIKGKDTHEITAVDKPHRFIVYEGSNTFNTVISLIKFSNCEFLHAKNYEEAYGLLKSGAADALIAEDMLIAAFDQYNDVETIDFLPLAYEPVLLATQNPELAPVISVVQKALDNGGVHYLNHLYNQGFLEYKRNKFFDGLSREELDYINNRPVVPFAAERTNYPVCFYNSYERQWQGIAIDVLHNIEEYTGLTFEIVNNPNTEWPELLEMTKSGQAAMISELIPSKYREDHFIWPKAHFMTDNYALISKSDFRDININEIITVKVGLVRDTAHADLFLSWFPDQHNHEVYDTTAAAFDALLRNEVDMVMSSYHQLLIMTHYKELAGYKANIVFDGSFDSTFGINKEETVLCSIIDKALQLTDTKTISGQWMRKTYDYRAKLAQKQMPWVVGAACLLLCVLVLVVVQFVRNRQEGKRLEILVQERTAEAEAANQAKSVFLANMSHEIRTPMNSIMGFAELARENDLSPHVRDYLMKIIDSTKCLLRIINDILDISKIEAGHIELENTPFDLQSVFSSCQLAILPGTNENISMQVYAEPLPGRKLVGDPVKLYQALENLLSNAVKFTHTGAVRMSSSIVRTTGDTATIYFEVKDSGIGMSPEQIENIFIPFMQGETGKTRHYGGTGLGLPIAKNIIEIMGGKLTVESTPGSGSAFGFELTFKTVSAQKQTGNTELNRPQFEGTILICEDNYMNQQLICTHLMRVGLHPVLAENGKSGLEMVRERMNNGQKNFDLIFMDIHMPEMDGVEASSRIKALGTGTPIVAMTANIMKNDLDNYKNNGMDDYLGKPYSTQELWQTLLKYITPVSVSTVFNNDHNQDESKLLKRLKTIFAGNNRDKVREITNAIAAGDIELAHRLAHTLKTNSGTIGKTTLQNAAAKIEEKLKDGIIPLADQLDFLENELNLVLEELQPLLDESAKYAREYKLANPDAGQDPELFEKLASMLEKINPECVNLLDEIRCFPGTEELARQIEDYDFESAAATLGKLKNEADTIIFRSIQH